MAFFKSISLQSFLHHCIVLLLILSGSFSYSQTYPVQVSISTTPPYFNYLSNFADQNNHLQLIATLTDFNTPPQNVYLRLRVEGPGYALQTRQDMQVGNTYSLSPGFPTIIQGTDLLPLMNPNNLTVISGNVSTNNLPEGLTTFCIDVVKTGTGNEILSTNNCTSFFLQLLQPPQATLPFCNSTVDTSQVFQTFQWTAPQNYVPSISTELSYTFSLYEWIDTTNFNIFQTGQGLVYSTQTNFPLAQVSNFDVQFQKGRKYVWRVQANLLNNGMPINVFVNNGISSPCSFYFGKPQTLAEQLTEGLSISLQAEAVGERKGRAFWSVSDATPGEGLSSFSSYIIEYRRKPNAGENYPYEWNEDTVSTLQLPIYQLQPEKTYEVRMSGLAGNYRSPVSDMVEFTTPAARNYACGEIDLPYLPTNYQPLTNAYVSQQFQIGQFTLEITQITALGTPGRYSGKGTIPHDFVGGARIQVTFDNILVDDQYIVREGTVQAVTKGVDNWLNGQYLSEAEAYADTVDGVIQTGGFLNDTTAFVVVNGDTLTYTFNGSDLPIIVRGDDNVEYQFWPDGRVVVTTYGVTPSTDSLDATKNIYVYFGESTNQQYGFDKKEYTQFAANYETIVCKDQFLYAVPNKSKARAGTDVVKAIIHGLDSIPGFQESDILFQLKGGSTTVPFIRENDSTFLLTLPEKNFTEYQVYAYIDGLKLGKLRVYNYEETIKKVRIVPLVSASSISKAQLETALNTQFKGANLKFNVTIAPVYSSSDFNSNTVLENPNTNLLSKYTDQMRALRDAYLDTNELEQEEYVVFLIRGFTDQAIDGYMVRGRAMGFVTQSALSTPQNFAKVLSHELGHGIGGLKHAWGEDVSAKGTTNNLMDYSSNTSKLTKEQWEGIRNGGEFSLFDDEEDFSSISASIETLSSFKNNNDTYTFLTPSKKKITLPSNTQSVWFSTLDRLINTDTGDESNKLAPVGSLTNYKVNNTLFGWTSTGYYPIIDGNIQKDENLKYIDNLSETSNPIGAITSIFCANENNVTTAFFMVPIQENSQINNWIIFDENSISKKDTDLNTFINHYRISSKPIVQINSSSLNIGPNTESTTTQFGIIFTDHVEGVFNPTPFNIFKITENVISVEYYLKYLILVNQNKSDFQFFSDCLNSKVSAQINKEIFDLMLKYVDPYNQPIQIIDEVGNFVQQKTQIEEYYKKYISEVVKLTNETAFSILNIASQNNDFEEAETWLNAQEPCVLRAIPPSIRKNAFNLFISNDNYWGLANILIETLPDYDKSESEKFFRLFTQDQNNKWLDLVIPQLDNNNGDETDLIVLNRISDGITELINEHLDEAILTPTIFTMDIIDPLNPFNENLETISYTPLSKPFFFKKENGSEDYFSEESGMINVNFLSTNTLKSITWSNGKVNVYQTYQISKGGTIVSNPNSPPSSIEVITNYSLNPYELVKVVFLDNYADQLGFGFDNGKEVIVPAYQLLLFQQSIENDVFYDSWKTIVNIGATTLAVLTAPLTLGGSLYAVGAVTLSVMNENIEAERNNALSSEQYLYDNWRNFYSVVGMLEGGYGAVRLIPNLPHFLLSTKDLIVNIKNLPANSSNFWKGIKSLFSASGAGKIIPSNVDEIKHLLKTDNGTSFFWSGKTDGIGGEIKALEIAKSKGGTTLEGLLKEKNIELPAWDPNNPNVMKLWEDVSAEYAKQVSGEVRAVIGQQLRPGNIWETKELPALMRNTNVTKITTIDPVTLIETVIFTR